MTNLLAPQALDALHTAMAGKVARGALPGLVSLVARIAGDEQETDVCAIGETGFGSGDPMRRDTPFRITSMTKPVVAAAAMALVDEGLLELDAPVDPLLPELAGRRVLERIDGPLTETVPAERPVTLRDLLTFRLGYGMVTEPSFDPPEYPVIQAAAEQRLVLGPPEPRTPHGPDEWIRRFGGLPLMDHPGSRWRYNVGSLVLGVLLARAAEAPLDDVVRTRVLEPLGMAHTGFSLDPAEADRLPAYYLTDAGSGKLERLPVGGAETWTRPPVFPSAAAGLASTADDYFAFAGMLLRKGVHEGRRVLSERAVAMMTTNQLTPEQVAGAGFPLSGHGWGFGLSVTVQPEPAFPVPGRYGWTGGFGTSWTTDPSRGLIAILLTQTTDVVFDGTLAEYDALASAAAG